MFPKYTVLSYNAVVRKSWSSSKGTKLRFKEQNTSNQCDEFMFTDFSNNMQTCLRAQILFKQIQEHFTKCITQPKLLSKALKLFGEREVTNVVYLLCSGALLVGFLLRPWTNF